MPPAFDDFIETNGATRIVPGSHEWSLERLPTEADAVDAVCPAGSAVYVERITTQIAAVLMLTFVDISLAQRGMVEE